MPRRPHKQRSSSNLSKWQKPRPFGGRDISRILDPVPRIESAWDGDWFLAHIPAAKALKTYKCPGCHGSIKPGIAHLVTWRDDHMFGRERGIEERRHWHQKCWRNRLKY